MALRTHGKLTARKVETIQKPGRYGDGGGLYLQVTRAGTKSWLFRYMIRGRARAMGLGSYPLVGLAEARSRADEKARMLLDGIDPLERKRAAIEAATEREGRTFRKVMDRYIEVHCSQWTNPKHAAQWRTSLEHHAANLMAVSVAHIGTEDVLRALEPIWSDKTETATRVRQRIEAILDYAKVRHYRDGENPARWQGHLSKLLPAAAKIKRVRHFPALPWPNLPEFMAELRELDGIGAIALEFAILTATRTGEICGATWSEIDLDAKTWTIPAERMKAKRPHRIPLSKDAIQILRRINDQASGEHIFPGAKPGRPMSTATMAAVLKRLGRTDITVHGFRSTFRDWAAESTHFPSEAVELALAHVIKDKTEAAYRRGDMFARRSVLMQAWADYCSRKGGSADVVPMRQSGSK